MTISETNKKFIENNRQQLPYVNSIMTESKQLEKFKNYINNVNQKVNKLKNKILNNKKILDDDIEKDLIEIEF